MSVIAVTDEELVEFLGQQESQFFAQPSEYASGVKDRLSGLAVHGAMLPWAKTHGIFRMRPGEITIWAGVNGHGKSQVTGMVAAWLCTQEKVAIASLEMPPASTLARMARQCAGSREPSDHWVDRFLGYIDDRVVIYDQLDSIEYSRVLGMTHYAAAKLGCRHIFIDSLMKCGIGFGEQGDQNTQHTFVDRLSWAAKAHNVHIHLVHHMRKGETEDKVPNKFDLIGSSMISNLVDNIIIVHRNKRKERLLAAGQDVEPHVPDALLRVDKQRHGEWEGDIKLWFDKDSQQYLPKITNRKMPWPTPDNPL